MPSPAGRTPIDVQCAGLGFRMFQAPQSRGAGGEFVRKPMFPETHPIKLVLGIAMGSFWLHRTNSGHPIGMDCGQPHGELLWPHAIYSPTTLQGVES